MTRYRLCDRILEDYPQIRQLHLGNYRYTFVSIMEGELQPGIPSCKNPHWHRDEGIRHYLWIESDNEEALTEFQQGEQPVLGQWFSYTGLDYHRGVTVSKPTQRLFLRVTETNQVLPYEQYKY